MREDAEVLQTEGAVAVVARALGDLQGRDVTALRLRVITEAELGDAEVEHRARFFEGAAERAGRREVGGEGGGSVGVASLGERDLAERVLHFDAARGGVGVLRAFLRERVFRGAAGLGGAAGEVERFCTRREDARALGLVVARERIGGFERLERGIDLVAEQVQGRDATTRSCVGRVVFHATCAGQGRVVVADRALELVEARIDVHDDLRRARIGIEGEAERGCARATEQIDGAVVAVGELERVGGTERRVDGSDACAATQEVLGDPHAIEQLVATMRREVTAGAEVKLGADFVGDEGVDGLFVAAAEQREHHFAGDDFATHDAMTRERLGGLREHVAVELRELTELGETRRATGDRERAGDVLARGAESIPSSAEELVRVDGHILEQGFERARTTARRFGEEADDLGRLQEGAHAVDVERPESHACGGGAGERGDVEFARRDNERTTQAVGDGARGERCGRRTGRCDVNDEVAGCAVGCVEIVDQNGDRQETRAVDQKAADRVEQGCATLGPGVPAGAGHLAAFERVQDFATALGDRVLGRCVEAANRLREDLDDGTVGGSVVNPVAAAAGEDGEPAPGELACECRHEAALADARLAFEHHHAAVPVANRRFGELDEVGQLLLATEAAYARLRLYRLRCCGVRKKCYFAWQHHRAYPQLEPCTAASSVEESKPCTITDTRLTGRKHYRRSARLCLTIVRLTESTTDG